MAGSLSGDSLHHGMVKSEEYNNSNDQLEEPDHSGGRWYFSRKEIEDNSSSRRDGIDFKKETYLRKSYCTFLQDLGMRLKVPQVTIATAIVFCHRFFLRQSLAKNDRRTIATVCMFLAGKVEETPRPLKDVILVSYEIIHKKDPSAVQRIKQKEVYEQQKELILLGERVVLATLGFDMNVHHPYKPLVEAIKKFKVAQNALAQVAWNFVNDGLRTSLCLQFKPHHIAAGAIFLAAKFLKVRLPSDGEKVWWQEFDVTPRQLEDVSNQMLELYEQNRTGPSSHPNEVEGSTGVAATNQPVTTNLTVSESSVSISGPVQDVGVGSIKRGGQAVAPAKTTGFPSRSNNDSLGPQSSQKKINDNMSADTKRVVWNHSVDTGGKNCSHNEVKKVFASREKNEEASSSSKSTLDGSFGDEVMNEKAKNLEAEDRKDEGSLSKFSNPGGRSLKSGEAARGYCMPDAITKIDKDKVKAALEKRRKLRNDVAKNNDIIDEDDLIERELENGIELPPEDEKIQEERRAAWPKSLNRQEADSKCLGRADIKDLRNSRVSEQLISGGRTKPKCVTSGDRVLVDHGLELELDNAEEGELTSLDELPSPMMQSSSGEALNMVYPSLGEYGTAQLAGVRRNRDDYAFCPSNLVAGKARSVGRQLEGLHQYENSDPSRDPNGTGWLDCTERDHKRHRFESNG